ncbi:MAG: NAD-dependent epimerase/dehydratase family protein, partial [Acidobacteria bacterium]|nr:NAD-dependent epimerase/dehydratase family protein [Acidobacteriota bacterium]
MRHDERTDSSPKKVLVVGGTLFIGRALVAELLKAGHEVWILHRKSTH